MKFTINGFEIEIKAKSAGMGSTRFNKEDTMWFMNQVAIWMREAGHYTAFEHRNDDGFYDNDNEAVEIGKIVGHRQIDESFKLHDQLSDYGCYDSLR